MSSPTRDFFSSEDYHLIAIFAFEHKSHVLINLDIYNNGTLTKFHAPNFIIFGTLINNNYLTLFQFVVVYDPQLFHFLLNHKWDLIPMNIKD